MVKLGVGFQCSDSKKRPACSAASQRAEWVELRPRTAAAAGGAVSELPGGRLLPLREGASVPAAQEGPCVQSPRTKCQGGGAVRQQGCHLCQTAIPHLRLKTPLRSTLSALSAKGDAETSQAQAPTFKELPRHWGREAHSEQLARAEL